MTKEDKIKEAYGLYWKDYGHLTDENGFIYQSDLFYPDTEMKKEGIEIQVISVEIKHKWSNIKWRPKSLSGIENNNGWIKIESEADLPKKEGIYLVFTVDAEIQTIYADGDISAMKHTSQSWNRYFTHYQAIIKPKPPIY